MKKCKNKTMIGFFVCCSACCGEQVNSPARVLITFPMSIAYRLSCISWAALVTCLTPETLLTRARLSISVKMSKHALLVTLTPHVHREVSSRESTA